MEYAVFVGAEGASVEEVENARLAYSRTLDRGLGGHSQARTCFMAFAKGHDGHPLSPAEIEQSAAWARAECTAREFAARPLPSPASALFTFRLNS